MGEPTRSGHRQREARLLINVARTQAFGAKHSIDKCIGVFGRRSDQQPFLGGERQ